MGPFLEKYYIHSSAFPVDQELIALGNRFFMFYLANFLEYCFMHPEIFHLLSILIFQGNFLILYWSIICLPSYVDSTACDVFFQDISAFQMELELIWHVNVSFGTPFLVVFVQWRTAMRFPVNFSILYFWNVWKT